MFRRTVRTISCETSKLNCQVGIFDASRIISISQTMNAERASFLILQSEELK